MDSEKSIKELKYEVIRRITKLNEKTDLDILKKLDKAIGMAYDDRTFYIAEIELCDERNNGEIILKTGWTRKTVKERYADKRNGYKGVHKIYKEYKINPNLAEELNKYINNKFACGKEGAMHNFTGKTEMIDTNKYSVEDIIKECDHFIDVNKYTITGRGKIN
jgi:DNA polymerase sigma